MPRENKKFIERDHVAPEAHPRTLPAAATELIGEVAERVRAARRGDRPVMMVFGAHAIKNGLGPVFLQLVHDGWVTHLATNGAGIIHDWEFAFQGKSCENVEVMVREGRFGNWDETGFFINLALNVGAYEGKGYGESVGAMIQNEGLTIPSPTVNCWRRSPQCAASDPGACGGGGRSADGDPPVRPGRRVGCAIRASLESSTAFRPVRSQAGVPFTGHPMIGHDIIYNHPMNHCACLGRVAERDFLTYAQSVSQLEGGVYISIGSAVMSPMIFEKSLSMAQNLAIQRGTHIDHHFLLISDLAESSWDWTRGEPPEDNPSYYLRYNKSFSRMGGTMRYLQADNRDFLLTLTHLLDTGTS